jgi:copper homeostasis protein
MNARNGFLEICVDSVAGARAAIAGGADGIELCSALELGGLTPSAGLVRALVAMARPAGVAVRAMVRPRAGGFAYDRDEITTAIGEARALLDDGVDGLVFGAARGGRLDRSAIEMWREGIGERAAKLTLHRAIDLTENPVASVNEAIALGFDQVLSSGGAASAWDGRETLARMVGAAERRCRIVAGAGVRPEQVGALVAAIGCRSIHASARSGEAAAGPDTFGFGTGSVPADEEVVRALRRAVDAAGG